jgi:hypothetical protein
MLSEELKIELAKKLNEELQVFDYPPISQLLNNDEREVNEDDSE